MGPIQIAMYSLFRYKVLFLLVNIKISIYELWYDIIYSEIAIVVSPLQSLLISTMSDTSVIAPLIVILQISDDRSMVHTGPSRQSSHVRIIIPVRCGISHFTSINSLLTCSKNDACLLLFIDGASRFYWGNGLHDGPTSLCCVGWRHGQRNVVWLHSSSKKREYCIRMTSWILDPGSWNKENPRLLSYCNVVNCKA